MSSAEPPDAILSHADGVGPILGDILKHVDAGLRRAGYLTYELTRSGPVWCKRAIGVARDRMTPTETRSDVALYVSFQNYQGCLQTAIVTPEEWFYPTGTTWTWDLKERGVAKPLLEIDREHLLRMILEELPKPRRLPPVSPKHWMPSGRRNGQVSP